MRKLRFGKSDTLPKTSSPDIQEKSSSTDGHGPWIIGKVHEQGAREYQQDSFGISDEGLLETHGQLFALADGMGGLEDGDKVSQTVIAAVLDGFLKPHETDDPMTILLSLVREANLAVLELLTPDGLGKSGSTLVLGLIQDRRMYFVSIGDSSIRLLRDGTLIQLNREHIFRHQKCLEAIRGELPLEEALTDAKGSALTSFIGMEELKAVDIPAAPVLLQTGDTIILMSDGVYHALSEKELIESISQDPEKAAEDLKQKIADKAFSNQDNYTAIIVKVPEPEHAGKRRRRK